MKKSLSAAIGFILFCFIFQADAQITRNRSYVINGTIVGVDSGIVRMLSNDMHVMDSAVIVKGKFVFRGKIGLPERKVFAIIPGNWSFRGFVDDSVITFNIDTSFAMHQYAKTKDYPIIWQIKETGSPLADVYAKYQNETGFTYGLSLLKKLKTAKKDSLAYIRNELDSIGKLLTGKEKLWVENYIGQNPSSLAGIYIFNEYYRSLRDTSAIYLRSVINQFSGAAKASSYYDALTKQLSILTNMQVSKLAPDFTLPKRDKNKFRFSTTRGSIVMLDFWASWCVPCRKGIPNWKKVYAKYHHKGFNIISVSDDRNWKDWVRALDQEKMPWTQVIDEFPSKGSPAKVGELYAVRSMPFFVLLDKKGKVILASGDEKIVTTKIEEILK
ncbi:MAG: Thiol-disulfide isomerase or thioredoxin [Mucilaginibacter sp.]|nr:Thiol-disulfide isomerase or thioredoxin [Mucilaginibacter sp.]